MARLLSNGSRSESENRRYKYLRVSLYTAPMFWSTPALSLNPESTHQEECLHLILVLCRYLIHVEDTGISTRRDTTMLFD